MKRTIAPAKRKVTPKKRRRKKKSVVPENLGTALLLIALTGWGMREYELNPQRFQDVAVAIKQAFK